MAHLSPVPNGYVPSLPFKTEGRRARRLHRDGIYPSKVQAAAARTMLLKVVDAVQWLIVAFPLTGPQEGGGCWWARRFNLHPSLLLR